MFPHAKTMVNSLVGFEEEQAIASLLLNCLAQGLDPEECTFHLERNVVDFFQVRDRRPSHAISPVVLEAIATLATAHPASKPRTLSCLLVLGAASVSSWNSITTSKIFDMHPELFHLLSSSIAGSNPLFQFLSGETKQAISSAFIDLSKYSTHAEFGRLRTLPSTPVSLAISGFTRNVNSHNSVIILTDVLQCLPFDTLASIPDDNWVQILDVALEHNINTKWVKLRSMLGLSRDTAARAELLRIIRKHPESGISHRIGSCNSIALREITPLSIENIFSSLRDVDTIEKAYQLVKRNRLDGDEKSVKNAASIWMTEKNHHLVASAYIAAPSALINLASNSNDVFLALKDIPETFCSPIDEVIDGHLLDLLSTVPEFSRLLRRKRAQGEKSSLLRLKRIAMIHPYLFARRLPCLLSSGRTVLYGLSNPAERYEAACLGILEKVFETICSLPLMCVDATEVEKFIVETMEFVLEENRAVNGVPDMFLALVLATFKAVSFLAGMMKSTRVCDLIEKVILGQGTSEHIREAAKVCLKCTDI